MRCDGFVAFNRCTAATKDRMKAQHLVGGCSSLVQVVYRLSFSAGCLAFLEVYAHLLRLVSPCQFVGGSPLDHLVYRCLERAEDP